MQVGNEHLLLAGRLNWRAHDHFELLLGHVFLPEALFVGCQCAMTAQPYYVAFVILYNILGV